MMLSVENLQLNYGAIKALHDISLKVDEGQIICLIGANGAGKSSVLHCISNTISAKHGKIFFKGERIDNLSAHKTVEKGIIHVPEGRHIFAQMTVSDNLLMGAYSRTDSISDIKSDVMRVYKLFPRLQERKKQLAGTLSGGEQQMLAIGRALMARPKLLMLDEPSMGLAPLLVKETFEIIKSINKEGTTILLVEQNANMALSVADYAYVLEVGNVTYQGNATELMNNGKLKKAYLGN